MSQIIAWGTGTHKAAVVHIRFDLNGAAFEVNLSESQVSDMLATIAEARVMAQRDHEIASEQFHARNPWLTELESRIAEGGGK